MHSLFRSAVFMAFYLLNRSDAKQWFLLVFLCWLLAAFNCLLADSFMRMGSVSLKKVTFMLLSSWVPVNVLVMSIYPCSLQWWWWWYGVCNILQHYQNGGGLVKVWGGISISTDLYRLDSGTLTLRNWDEILGLTVRPYTSARWCTTVLDLKWWE